MYFKIAVLIFGVMAPLTGLLATDFIIKNQSDFGLEIEFTPQQWEMHREAISGRSYWKIAFENGTVIAAGGEPQSPERILIVGIPFHSAPTSEVFAAEEQMTLQGKIIPAPTYRHREMTEIYYDEDETSYRSSRIIPDQLVDVSEPAMLGDQQVVIVRIKPVQFIPGREQIKLYKKITVRLNFSVTRNYNQPSETMGSHFDQNQLLINPNQAAKWRAPSQKANQVALIKASALDWYKIYVREEGIYKITGAQLKTAGIDLREIPPTQVKIFNNGGLPLPQEMTLSRIDSLIETAILVSDGGDHRFDEADYILFYGKAVNGWTRQAEGENFSHDIHPYTRDNVYWLGWQSSLPGKRMQVVALTNITPTAKVDSYREFFFIENEYTNLLKSGTTWFGDYFSASFSRRNYQFDLSGIELEKNADFTVNLAGVSPGLHRFRFYINERLLPVEPEFYNASGKNLSYTMRQFSTSIMAGLQRGYNTAQIEFLPSGNEGLAYLDWIEFSYQRKLEARNDQLVFHGADSATVYQYDLRSFSSEAIFIFDVTDFHNVRQIEIAQHDAGVISFIDSAAGQPRRYFAVHPTRFKSTTKIMKDVPSRLREDRVGADFIIITYDDFYDAALALKSLRENCDSLATRVVKISDVFDEFGWGLPDPTAIRDYIRFAYVNWTIPPKYVLLLGDGDYDYKNIISPESPNWILPYETNEPHELLSRARDDWFGCVAGNDNLMDVAIGRIPARNPDQALAAIQKIIEYENSPALGEWCNTIAMVADDELEQGGKPDVIHHIPDAEAMAEGLIPPTYNVKKIYLTEFPAVADAAVSGIRKPAAHDALLKQIDKGNLIINFIGHGNERLWTHERILVLSDDFPLIDTGPRQAFWIAATCNFGRFDNPDFQSFAEQLTTMPNNGAIAVFSPCRLADATQNVSLNKAIYRFLFSQNQRSVRLGDVISLAKNSLGNSENSQFYNLLGDPTLRLKLPGYYVTIEQHQPDSLKALCRMEVAGSVNQLFSDESPAQGQILFEAFDSKKERVYKVNEWRDYRYRLPGNTIFKGSATYQDGRFQVRFFVPKDITYGGNAGRFSAFYWDGRAFGSGCLDNISVGGTESNHIDNEGPVIRIRLNGQYVIDQECFPLNPILHLSIADSLSGVNMAGDLGHEITMILDDAQEKQIILTDFFQYDKDSYRVGNIVFPLGSLPEGMHSIQVKAWDNSNNSSRAEARFTIVATDRLVIRDVFNFPNPVATTTEFTFWVNQDCDVEIKIYSLAGRSIFCLENLSATAGFNHFVWTGEDADGNDLANGVYLYKVKARRDRFRMEQIEKLVIMR